MDHMSIEVVSMNNGYERCRHTEEQRWQKSRTHACERTLIGTQQHVGCTVPQRNDLVRVAPDRNAKSAGQAKVGQLQLLLLVDQQILRLKVAVQHLVFVAERNPLEQLEQKRLVQQQKQQKSKQASSAVVRNVQQKQQQLKCVLLQCRARARRGSCRDIS